MIADPLIGRHIGNYIIRRLIGEGGMGAVYLAENPQIELQVAIKVLNQRVRDECLFRFINEAKAAARIRHPNIIEIYDFGRMVEGWPYCVMEYLVGKPLSDVMDHVLEQRGRMVPKEVFPFAEQICGALQAAHDHGIVHRDLKPDNIFIQKGKPMRLKVLDFGLAKLMDDGDAVNQTKTGTVFGTPLFLAPEQAAGQVRKITGAADIYSLGVLLYWMLAGDPPLKAETVTGMLIKTQEEVPRALAMAAPGIPPEISRLVMQCLEKGAEDRPSSAKEIATRFGRAIGVQLDQDKGIYRTNPGLGVTLPTFSEGDEDPEHPVDDLGMSLDGNGATPLPTPIPPMHPDPRPVSFDLDLSAETAAPGGEDPYSESFQMAPTAEDGDVLTPEVAAAFKAREQATTEKTSAPAPEPTAAPMPPNRRAWVLPFIGGVALLAAVALVAWDRGVKPKQSENRPAHQPRPMEEAAPPPPPDSAAPLTPDAGSAVKTAPATPAEPAPRPAAKKRRTPPPHTKKPGSKKAPIKKDYNWVMEPEL